MEPITIKFKDLSLSDQKDVGGKNASLGEMFSKLTGKGIRVPNGFATTSFAFWKFIDHNQLRQPLKELMDDIDKVTFANLKACGKAARELIVNGEMPEKICSAIISGYRELCGSNDLPVAVRSSATAEDLPNASFAGQHDSFLNIKGEASVLFAVKRCFTSLYTDRAIKYRYDNGFDHEKIALSAGIQKMVQSDEGCSGVAFTLEPESGSRDIIHISGVWGLGENLVQGTVTPDEFMVFKPTFRSGKNGIIQKSMGDKSLTMVYADPGSSSRLMNIATPLDKQRQFVLDDREINKLAAWCLEIEAHYARPMDIEWAKDGITGELFILQARPETVQSLKNPMLFSEYVLLKKGVALTSGQAIGTKISTGIARVLHSPLDAAKLQPGEIVVTTMTSPDWDPILKNAGGIITDKGGRTSHASIVARELGVPAIVGCSDATTKIEDGTRITLSCAEGRTGFIYRDAVPYKIVEHDFSGIEKTGSTEVMLIVADPAKAFKLALFPNDGVGLMRIEFIINHSIGIHPMALAKFNALKDETAVAQIKELTINYPDKKQFFIGKLSEGIAVIAAAFYPKDVIVRMSDFKTNEYAHLIGGAAFEPAEENPMLGFRGASRYYNELYREGFAMECAAIRKAREVFGFTNLKPMIPFCRTVEEAKKVIGVMAANGLDREKDPSLQIYMMCEIPSNVLLAEKFAMLFDGFSIGSNDLTQLTLGIDRDSEIVSHLFNEQDEAARMMISMLIDKAHASHIKIGICGQAPSDYPEFATFLVEKGINSISFNPDALMRGIENISAAEKNTRTKKGATSMY